MKRLISILIMAWIAMVSQFSIAQSGLEYSTQHTNMKPRYVQSVPRISKVKVFRSNPYKLTHRYVDESDDDYVDDDYLMSPYRRQDLFKIVTLNEDISDNVRWRLFLARQLAVLKHQAKYH